MVNFLVKRPIAVLTSFFALMLLGATAYFFLPTSLLPATDIPQVIVKVKGPNYAAREVEQNLIGPIRNNLLQLHGLKRIESKSSEGSGIIRLIFEHGTNTSMSFIETNEKVDVAMNHLPRNIERPLVSKSSIADIPVFNLNIYPKNQLRSSAQWSEISNFARDVIRRRIEQLPAVAMVDMSGFMQPEIQLVPKEGYLQSIGIESNTLLNAFQENKISLGNIMVKDGHYQYFLKFSSEAQTVLAIENTPVNIQGRMFKLSDLVSVSYAQVPESGTFFSDGQRAINFEVIKQSEAKMNDLKNGFGELMEHLRQDYPDIVFKISQDQTSLLDYSVSNLEQDLALGAVLAFLLMLIFIRKIRAALIIGITIPCSLLISQLGFYLTGISINIISLGGLILGLGMIIDNSIVVIDNITRYRGSGLEVTESIVKGTNEVIRPLITSVLTNCAVFIPLVFMSGIAGAMFYDQALSITIGVISSLLVSVVLLPPLYKIIHSSRKGQRKNFEIRPRVHITGWYETVLKKCFTYPVTTCLIVLGMLSLTLFVSLEISKERLPPITRFDTEMRIDWNENIGIDENEKRIADLLQVSGGKIAESSAWVGIQQYFLWQSEELGHGQSKLYLRTKKADELNSLKRFLAKYCTRKYPSALIVFSPAKNAFDEVFSDDLAPLQLNVSAADKNKMPEIQQATQFIDSLRKQLPDLEINPLSLYEKLVLHIDAEKAALYGVNTTYLAKQVEDVFKPLTIDNLQGTQIMVPIVLVNRNLQSVHDMLSGTFIRNPENQEIPLINFITVSKTSEYKNISANIQGEYYPIEIYTDKPKQDLLKIKNLIKADFNNLDVSYSGGYFDNLQLIGQMSLILMVSVLLLYFILAAQFESLIQPLFILIELPIALSGAVISLYIAGNSLNLMSMIGIIVMSGLIINDSILKIDAINLLRNEGVPLLEAIYEGGHRRLKPIVMIGLTSIGSLAPTLFMSDLGSELQKPLALTLIGGMLIGMFVSLFFVPLLYWFVYRGKKQIKQM